jgi:hypothetical protein
VTIKWYLASENRVIGLEEVNSGIIIFYVFMKYTRQSSLMTLYFTLSLADIISGLKLHISLLKTR